MEKIQQRILKKTERKAKTENEGQKNTWWKFYCKKWE